MGMTKYQFRDVLEIDLKTTTLVSDPEKDRAVDRAVADMSRSMPLQAVYETTLVFAVTGETFTTPATSSATAIVNAKDISASVDGNTCTLATKSWSPARTVKLTITDANASITSFTVIVKGIDELGYYQEESLYFRGGLVQTGAKLFAYISEVEIDQITGNAASDVLSIGTGLHTGVWQPLANKPIKPRSETITGLTRDTDYEIDYINGRVKLLPSMGAASTEYTIAYTKSELGISIANIIPDLIRIRDVEYPVDQVPQKFVSFSMWGNFLYIGSQGVGESQVRLTSTQHIAIYYEKPHQPPSLVSGGSYPDLMDEVIAIGAGAYCLLVRALQYEIQAETDLTALGTALTNVKKYLDNNTTVDVIGILAVITSQAASLRTAINTALDAAKTYLNEVDTTDLAGSGNDGAEVALKAGEDKIDNTNEGKDVGDLYKKYSEAWQGIASARTNAAMGFNQEANIRLANLNSYIAQAGGYDNVSGRFIQEAQFRAEQVNGDLVLADRFRAEGIERLNEFYAILKVKAEWYRRVSKVSLHQPA